MFCAFKRNPSALIIHRSKDMPIISLRCFSAAHSLNLIIAARSSAFVQDAALFFLRLRHCRLIEFICQTTRRDVEWRTRKKMRKRRLEEANSNSNVHQRDCFGDCRTCEIDMFSLAFHCGQSRGKRRSGDGER